MKSNTRLHVSELASLTPASFNLDGSNPTVRVKAAYMKDGDPAELPLRPDLVDLLCPYVAPLDRDLPVWPGTWTERAAQMLKDDLARAEIDYQDSEGRFRDFHSLRHRFGSELAMANVPPKVAQTSMRHSTITLTLDRYSHVGLWDSAAALEKLPLVPGPPYP